MLQSDPINRCAFGLGFDGIFINPAATGNHLRQEPQDKRSCRLVMG
jgi:hypothetical protein